MPWLYTCCIYYTSMLRRTFLSQLLIKFTALNPGFNNSMAHMLTDKQLYDLLEQGGEAIQAYLTSLDQVELPGVLSRIAHISKTHPLYETNEEFRNSIAELEDTADELAEAVAIEEGGEDLLNDAKLQIVLDDAEDALQGMRNELVKVYYEGGDNYKGMMQMMAGIMNTEASHHLFAPENWNGLTQEDVQAKISSLPD